MAQDKVTLYNLALNAVGTRSVISDPDEKSKEAAQCRLWEPIVTDIMLKAAHWPCARKTDYLALFKTRNANVAWATGDPHPEFLFTYSVPADFLWPRATATFSNFQMGTEEENTVIYSNEEKLLLTFTKRQSVSSAWDPNLFLSVALGLASYITAPLTGKPSHANWLAQQANNILMEAKLLSANSDMVEYESIPDWLVARGAGLTTNVNRFIHQTGPLLTMAPTNAK